jgi:hypothetical protein
LQGKGFTQQDMKGIVDARIMDVLYDGYRYRALQKSKPAVTKKLKTLPKVVKPGAARDKGEINQDRRTAKVRRLAKTGSRDAAASFFEDLV